jgi:hypothetical protein
MAQWSNAMQGGRSIGFTLQSIFDGDRVTRFLIGFTVSGLNSRLFIIVPSRSRKLTILYFTAELGHGKRVNEVGRFMQMYSARIDELLACEGAKSVRVLTVGCGLTCFGQLHFRLPHWEGFIKATVHPFLETPDIMMFGGHVHVPVAMVWMAGPFAPRRLDPPTQQ